jgi:predicted AAA+ superfamily ATPase
MLDLARLSDIPNTTLRRYINVLEKIYLIKRIKPIDIKGVVRSDRLLFTDTGILCHLLGLRDKDKIKSSVLHKNILKNFVTLEIMKQLSWGPGETEIFYYSTPSGAEVDMVVKNGDLYAGIAINPGIKISNRVLKGFEDVKK